MNTTRSAHAAADGSCVTITSVRSPSSTVRRSRSSTPRPERVSSAPVGSSAKITSGSETSARAIATRCCWPPESCAGGAGPGRRARRPRAPRGSWRAGCAAPASRDGSDDVLLGGQRAEQVEGLKDEADALAPQPGERVLGQPAQLVLAEPHAAGRGTVEPGGELQQRRLAGARRPHDRRERAPLERQRDAVERAHRAVAAPEHADEILELDHAAAKVGCSVRGGLQVHANSVPISRVRRRRAGTLPRPEPAATSVRELAVPRAARIDSASACGRRPPRGRADGPARR